MTYGAAVNCARCKLCISHILTNVKKERICADCLQIEYDKVCGHLDRAFDELKKANEEKQKLNERLQSILDETGK